MQKDIFDQDLKQFLDEELIRRSYAASITFVFSSLIAVSLFCFFNFFNPLIATFLTLNAFANIYRFKFAYEFRNGKSTDFLKHLQVLYITLTIWSLIFIFGSPMDIQHKYSLYFIIYIQCALVLAGTFTSVVVNQKLCDFLIVTSLILPAVILIIRSLFLLENKYDFLSFIIAYIFLALYSFKQSRLVRDELIKRFRSEWLLTREKIELKNTLENLKKTQQELEIQRANSLNVAKNLSLGDMAAGIAHEINNPLAVIIGHCDVSDVELERLSKDQGLSYEKIRNSILKIRSSGARIENIIKGLRFFSKTSDAEIFTENSFNKILNDTLTFLNEKIKKLSIKIEFTLSEKDLIFCQAMHISHVLFHLINNAVEAVSRCDHREIKIQTYREKEYFVFSIKDSGPGIDTSIQSRIFEPFFTTKEIGKGSGLGLSISKGIIENHKGVLFVDPQNNNTMVFKIPTNTTT